MNWNAAQTFEPWRTCPACGKEFRQDEPGTCSVACEQKMEEAKGPRTTDLPDGMVSAEALDALCREHTKVCADAGAGVITFDVGEIARELRATRKALDEAQARIAELEKERDALIAEHKFLNALKNERTDSLAASQAEVRELREALEGVPSAMRGWFSYRQQKEGSISEHMAWFLDRAVKLDALLSRPTGTQDALRAVIKDTISECAMTMRSNCGCDHCDEMAPGWKGDEIAARVLGEVAP